MKTINIPKPVFIRNLNGEIVLDESKQELAVSFKNFLETTILLDPKFGKSMATILAAVEIKKQLSDKKEQLVLENKEWEVLKDVVSEPTNPYNPAIATQLVEFFQAIMDAK